MTAHKETIPATHNARQLEERERISEASKRTCRGAFIEMHSGTRLYPVAQSVAYRDAPRVADDVRRGRVSLNDVRALLRRATEAGALTDPERRALQRSLSSILVHN
jgi:hypothetical protein